MNRRSMGALVGSLEPDQRSREPRLRPACPRPETPIPGICGYGSACQLCRPTVPAAGFSGHEEHLQNIVELSTISPIVPPADLSHHNQPSCAFRHGDTPNDLAPRRGINADRRREAHIPVHEQENHKGLDAEGKQFSLVA